MGLHLIKPTRESDFYVEYSDIVDCPVSWGSRADMLASGTEPDRLTRAEIYGTSSYIGDDRWKDVAGDDDYPWIWLHNVDTQMRVVLRTNLQAFCESYDKETGKFDLSLTEVFVEGVHG